MKNIILRVLAKPLLAGLCFFVITFTIYFFNLDMKATSKIEPFLLRHYDRIPRQQYLLAAGRAASIVNGIQNQRPACKSRTAFVY